MSDQVPVPRALRTAADWGWRVLVLGAAGFFVLRVLGKLELVVVAMFVGLIIAALVGPLVQFLDRYVPRGIAVLLGMLVLFGVFFGIIAFITGSIAGEWTLLSQKFGNGVRQIETLLEGTPFHVKNADFVQWFTNARTWLIDHKGDILKSALGSASTVAEMFVGLALAVFGAVCFLAGGSKIWTWAIAIIPTTSRSRVDGAGHVAWRSFAGYTRGIILVAASNALIVCIGLLILQVPLAVPLALIVFFGTFIPLIGAPLAMIVAVVVALAARGPITALIVLIGIALVGQFEGHVLQPLVMSRAVHLHPLAVALAVTSGSILGGLVGAVIAVPVVSVIYGVCKFWFKTAPPDDPLPPVDVEPETEPAPAEPAPAF